MSSKQQFKALPPCFGEAFVEDFFFSSIMSNSIMHADDVSSTKQCKDYIQWAFFEDDVIKSKFSVNKASHDDTTTTHTTYGERQSYAGSKRWGWSTIKYDAIDKEPRTPIAKKAK